MSHTYNTDNIILIGMPGAGKSTIGVVLAKILGYTFVDGDLVIQEQTGQKLHQIIAERGDEGFRALENEVNAALDVHHAVIATGGSAIYGAEAMAHFKEIGTVVFLHLPYGAIEMRLGDLRKRGVTIKEGQTLLDLYNERVPLYKEHCSLKIYCGRKSIRKIVSEILRKLSLEEET